MAPSYRDVKASGIRLRVTDVGQGPTLLLLHTALLDRTAWHGMLDALTKHFRVIAPDLPGFGESEKPTVSRFAYDVAAFTHVVIDLFAALGLGQAHLAGHGLGGAVALSLANSSPELVSQLILVDSMCYQTRPDLLRRVAELPFVGGFTVKQLWGKALFRSYCREVLTDPKRPMALPRVDHYYEQFNTPSARNSALATLRATADTRPVVANTARVSARSLVVWGRHDAMYPAALGQRLAREIRGAGFQLLDSGHTPSEEQPEALAEVFRKFCSFERA
ncbi:MAG: hypothetical protein RJA70_1627 [Pseudomonadota bacterium]